MIFLLLQVGLCLSAVAIFVDMDKQMTDCNAVDGLVKAKTTPLLRVPQERKLPIDD